VNFNQGCGVNFTVPDDSPFVEAGDKSYGAPFNEAGGGWYVMQKSLFSGINVWFWSREDRSVPPEISLGGSDLLPNPLWGPPWASFPTLPVNCDYNTHFDAHIIIFDLTFCVSFCSCCPTIIPETYAPCSLQGDFGGGSTWTASGCGAQGGCDSCKLHAARWTLLC